MTTTTDDRLLKEWRSKLAQYEFDYFVTLSSNFGEFRYEQMRDKLEKWDALCNRYLNQSKWANRPDERLIWFAFIEKLGVNPHWHLVVQLDTCPASPERAKRYSRFPEMAAVYWKKVTPTGSFDCQTIDSHGVLSYATKALGTPGHFEKFIFSREFLTN